MTEIDKPPGTTTESPRLRIADVRATVVNVPSIRTCAWSGGATSGCTRTIIEIETASGLIGLGEAPGDQAATLVNSRFRSRLIGVDAIDRYNARRICVGAHNDFGTLADPIVARAFSGIEIALWDLFGKALGIPVYRALGGATRTRAPFMSYAYTVDCSEGHDESDVPEIMAAIACDSINASGAHVFEFKVGRHALSTDIATLAAVREALDHSVRIGVDANMAFSVDTAREFLAAARSIGLDNIEEPVSSLAHMERLRVDFGVPVSTHCTDMAINQIYPAIDGIVGDLHGDGGIEGNIRKAALAAAIGKRYWLRSCQELGIAFAAMCHVAMVSEEMERPHQQLINWVEHDLLEGERWRVRDGGVRPPNLPGLGVSLDRAALSEYSARYTQEGPLTYYDRP